MIESFVFWVDLPLPDTIVQTDALNARGSGLVARGSWLVAGGLCVPNIANINALVKHKAIDVSIYEIWLVRKDCSKIIFTRLVFYLNFSWHPSECTFWEDSYK